MPRVRIKRLPSNKRKVRIKKYPSTDYSLPNKVNYAGLQKFIFDNGGASGGVNSPIDKNNVPIEPLPFLPALPGKEIVIPGITDRERGEDELYTEEFKEKWGITDGQAFDQTAFGIGDTIAGWGQGRKDAGRAANQLTYAEDIGPESGRIDTGKHNYLTGLPHEDMMGGKIQNVQRGGVPLYNPGGPTPPSTFDKDGNEWVTVTGYYTGAENPDAADVSGDASTYYGQIKKTPYTKRILRSDYDRLTGAKGKYHTQQEALRGTKYGTSNRSFDDRGYNVAATNPNYKYALGVDEVKKLNPEYYPSQGELFDLNEEILGMKPIDLRGVKGQDKYTVKENPFGFRQQQLDVQYDVAYGDCPPCPDGSVPERDADNNCLECPKVEVEAEETVTETKKCKCLNDPAEGPFTGTIVTDANGKQECECTGYEDSAQQQQQQRDPEWWLQDTIKTTGLARDLATARKYSPQLQQVDLEEGEASFVDPTRELAANAEQANIAAQAASSFAGPQGTSRLSGIQGKAAANAANIMSKYNQQNVGIANQIAQANQNTRNQEALQNAKFRQQYYDQNTIANQQFDNTQRVMRNALRDQYGNAVTNMMTTDAMNQLYPNYAVSAASGGKSLFTGADGRKVSPTYQQNYATFLKEGQDAGATWVEADKSARSRADKQLLSESGGAGDPRYGGYPGSSSGKYGQKFKMLGGNVYEHGGEHAAPFGSSNMSQIQPPSYTQGVSQNNIPWGSQTTSMIKGVPREDANLEAEGGETVFGDINGDGFPETNKISGPRHGQGGVPLNLPDDSFIFSDYKKGNMQISDPEVLKMFGKSGKKRKGSRKKPSYTPAELAKQYDINKYRALLQDPDADKISKRTAEIMIENYNMKLGALALVQESTKGFPQGIPKVAKPYMEESGISEQDLMPQQQQPQNTIQRPTEQMFSEAEVIEEQT